MITKQEAIDQFKSIIGTKATWVRLAKSQFVEHMAIFLSWALRSALWAVERAKQEFFLSTAVNDSSVLAHVEDREYIPRKATPSTGDITVTNDGGAQVSIALGVPLQGENQLLYVTTTTAQIPAGQSAAVTVEQVEEKTIEHTVTEEKAFYQILFDKADAARMSSFTVEVDGTPWEYARLFQNVTAAALAYDQFYTHDGFLGIRFGNGTFGAIPAAGAVVTILARLTDGETLLLPGKELTPVDEILDDNSDPASLTIVAAEALTGGADPEPISETRVNLHYWPMYNDKLVWQDDYEFFIARNFPSVLWSNVWGETEEEAENGAALANINKIFFSAYATGNASIGTQILAALNEVVPLNRKFEFRAPSISPFTVAVTGKVAKSVIVADAVADIQAALTARYDKDSTTRLGFVSLKDIYAAIDATGHFSDSRAYFEVAVGGTLTPTMLHELIDFDLAGSTFTLTYL